jgi:hypothetical protein
MWWFGTGVTPERANAIPTRRPGLPKFIGTLRL